MQTIATDQLPIARERAELAEERDADDTDRELQRKSDQAEYGLGDRSDDYPHDTPVIPISK